MKYLFALSIKSIKFVANNRRDIFVVQLFSTQALYFTAGCSVYVTMVTTVRVTIFMSAKHRLVYLA